MQAHRLAIAAAFREDLRRCAQALEALQVLAESLAMVESAPEAPLPPDLAIVQTSSARPASAIAAALVKFLAAGGRLEADLEEDLYTALCASIARRGPIPPIGPAV